MADKKNKTAQAKKTPPPSKPKRDSAGKKRPISASSGKSRPSAATEPVATKRPSGAASKTPRRRPAPKVSATPAAQEENRVIHAAKKAIDDIAANRNVGRTKKATKEMAHQLIERAEHMVKDAASASSETVGKARKATRRTAYNFIKSAIKFLESVEDKIEAKPARKKASGKKPTAKPAAAKKTAKKPVKKKSSPAPTGKTS